MNPLILTFALSGVPVALFNTTTDSRPAAASKQSTRQESSAQCAVLPQNLTSFGACELDQWIYLFGGHTEKPHRYHSQSQNTQMFRFSVLEPNRIEIVPGGKPLQSVALVSYGSNLYRVGGMTALNADGEKQLLKSTEEFASFDPVAATWKSLVSLPQPRSSHDAVFVGSTLFVAGGWTLNGETPDADWLGDVISLNISNTSSENNKGKWTTVTTLPEKRRGIAAAALTNKLFIIGGMNEEGDLSKRVDIYDIEKNSWSPGPELPSHGFGCAAVVIENNLYVSLADGVVYQYAPGAWNPAAKLQFPRYFHRFVPLPNATFLAIGGTGEGGPVRIVESVSIHSNPPAGDGAHEPAFTSYTLPFPGKAKNRQAMFLKDQTIYLFGGNNSLTQHAFGAERFVTEGWKLSLRTLQLTRLADLPKARQSMLTLMNEDATAGYAAGGFGFAGERAHTMQSIFKYSFKTQQFEDAGELPEPRSQAGAAAWGGDLWLFGGWDHDPKRGENSDRYYTQIRRLHDNNGKIEAVDCSLEIPRIRRAFGGAMLGDSYYMIGGLGETFEAVDVCDVFNFTTKTFSTIPNPSVPRINPQWCALNNKLYLYGGTQLGSGDGGSPVFSVEEYDPQAKSWRIVCDTVPNTTKDTRMFACGERLLFISTNDAAGNTIRITWMSLGNN
ncbi:MAG: Kelch repeat-containing protein [Planctomycetota bacterium]